MVLRKKKKSIMFGQDVLGSLWKHAQLSGEHEKRLGLLRLALWLGRESTLSKQNPAENPAE